MRVLHCADLHIGFAAYQRLTRDGINVREHDVGLTLTRFVDEVIAVAPDAVVIAGDVFHSARPSNHAIILAYAQFSRLVAALPNTPIVMAAGNHDLSKTGVSGCILKLFRELGIHVADHSAMRFSFPPLGLSVLAVPDIAGVNRPELRPDPSSRYNVLCLHGDARGVRQGGADRRASLTDISSEEMGAEQWSYIGLGHYHQYEQIALNAFYSGSIDFTSSNIWAEIPIPKGFIVRDLATGAHTFHALPAARLVIDCPPIQAFGETTEAIDLAIRDALADIPADAIVRLMVHDIERSTQHSLDQKALNAYRRRFLHFRLDYRRPSLVKHGGALVSARCTVDDEGAGRRKTLREEVDARMVKRIAAGMIPADVDGEAVRATVKHYLDLAYADDEPSDTIETELRDSIAQKPVRKSA